MAKTRTALTLSEMEVLLGYDADSLMYPNEFSQRFYSDLTPVSCNPSQRMREEFEELERKRRDHVTTTSDQSLQETGLVQIVTHGDDEISLTCINNVAFYNFAVDVHHGFGLELPLLFTSDEALTLMSVTKLQCTTTSSMDSKFFTLPQEIRNKIYVFALTKGIWKIQDTSNCDQFNFPAGLGDPSGFYFPLSRDYSMLRVNKRMRQEGLPLAYRRIAFRLIDIEELIKLLLAVGKLGRDNIESLEFAWESKADCERSWEMVPASEEIAIALPILHATRCTQLLKQCKRLRFLRLYIESDLICKVPIETFQTDPGIRELCAVRGIQRVEIQDLSNEPLEQNDAAKWLKEQLECPENIKKDSQQSGESDDESCATG